MLLWKLLFYWKMNPSAAFLERFSMLVPRVQCLVWQKLSNVQIILVFTNLYLG